MKASKTTVRARPMAFALALTLTLGLAGCTGASTAPAATVNGVKVAESAVTAYVENFRATSSLEDDAAWAAWLADNGYTSQSVREEVVDYYVDQELTRQAAQERGVSVDAAKLDEAVQKAKEGYSSDEAWKEALESSNTTEEAYREQVELSLLKESLAASFEGAEGLTDEQLLERAAAYVGAKRSSCILFESDKADEAQEVRDRIEKGEVEFAAAAEEHSIDESAEEGGDKGWDAFDPVDSEYAEALASLQKGGVSEPVETDGGVLVVTCTDEFEAPEDGLSDLSQVPDAILDSVRASLEGSGSTAYNEWFAAFKEKAEIVVNPLPEEASYNKSAS